MLAFLLLAAVPAVLTAQDAGTPGPEPAHPATGNAAVEAAFTIPEPDLIPEGIAYDPDDGTFLHDKSPLFFAEQIERPLMVLQGANDPRVLKEESDEIVAAVKANSVPVEYVLFTDEGHGFVKRENQIRGYEAMKQFLERHL